MSRRRAAARQDKACIEQPGNLPYMAPMKTSDEKTARLEARLPAGVHALLRRAADIQGRTLSDFVVSAAHEAARKTIEEAEIIRLSLDDQRRLADALRDPPAATAALRKAFQARRKLLGKA